MKRMFSSRLSLLPGLLPLLVLFGLGSASAAVKPGWIEADFDGNGQKDLISTSNLADVVFNPEGEIIGWYPKVVAGSKFINGESGNYSFDKLKKSVNLMASAKALDVQLPGNTAKPQAKPFKYSADIPQNRLSATFNYTQGGVSVTKTVTLHPRQFGMDAEINVQGTPNYTVNFGGLGRNQEPQVKASARGQESVQSVGSVQNIQYAALSDKPGASALTLIVRPAEGTRADASLTGGQKANLALKLSGDAKLDIYGGRNELIHLYQEGYYGQLPGVFTPNIFGQGSLLVVKLMEWLYGFLHSWGLVIVAITVLIRLAIWPLMQSQARYTARMQFMQPEIQKINEKYKDDQQKKSEATMALYKEHNVNPIGCLPMFIQFPFLIVLYSTIRNFEFDSGLWWLPDLSIPDPFYILAALYVGANLLSLYVMTRKTPQMFKQQSFLYIIFAYFALTFPAGVTLYWILSTLFTALQQWLINRQMEAQAAIKSVQRVTAADKPAVAGAKLPSASQPVKSQAANSQTVIKPQQRTQGNKGAAQKALPKGKRQKE